MFFTWQVKDIAGYILLTSEGRNLDIKKGALAPGKVHRNFDLIFTSRWLIFAIHGNHHKLTFLTGMQQSIEV